MALEWFILAFLTNGRTIERIERDMKSESPGRYSPKSAVFARFGKENE
jgi:hypothetical protein